MKDWTGNRKSMFVTLGASNHTDKERESNDFYALDFIKHSLELLPDDGLCIMFLKTTFLEGQKRYDELFSKHPPQCVLQFSRRVLCAKNGEFQKMKDGGGSAVSYAWFVWKKGYYGDFIVRSA